MIKKTKPLLLLLLSSLLFLHGAGGVSLGAGKPLLAVFVSASNTPYKEAKRGFDNRMKSLDVEYDSFVIVLGDGVSPQEALAMLKSKKPVLIHTIGTQAARLAGESFKDIPIVFSMVLNPVDSGLVKGMNSSGNNLTGASMDIPASVQFRKIKALFPDGRRMGVIYNPSETGKMVEAAKDASAKLGMEILGVAVDEPSGVPVALGELLGKVDLLWSVADSHVFTRETSRELLSVTLKNKLPFVGLSPAFVKAGALMAFEMDPFDMGRQAADAAKRVLMGEKPSNVPISTPLKVRTVLNSNTIDLLDIRIPEKEMTSARIIGP